MSVLAVKLTDVCLERAEKLILNKINFTISNSQHSVIMGRNGCGKTTILNLIYGMFWPSRGTVEVLANEYGHCEIAKVRKKIGILQPALQNQLVQNNLSVFEILAGGLMSTLGYFQDLDEIVPGGSLLVENKLAEMGWLDKKNQPYQLLSAGEKNKLLFERAVIHDPDLLLLDEPTAALDYFERDFFFRRLNRFLAQENKTAILISHRLEEVPACFNNFVLVKDGAILCQGSRTTVCTNSNLNSCYGTENLNYLSQ